MLSILFTPHYEPVLEELFRPGNPQPMAKGLLGTSQGANGRAQRRDALPPRSVALRVGKGYVHLTDLHQNGRSISSGPQETLQNHRVALKHKSG